MLCHLKAHKGALTSVKFHPAQSSIILSASVDHHACLWRDDGSNKYSTSQLIPAHSDVCVAAAFHPSGDYFLTASTDRTWSLHSVATQQLVKRVSIDTAPYTKLAVHPDGIIIGCGTAANEIRIFDAKQTKNVATFTGHTQSVSALCFSENGYHLASADFSGVVKLWDLRKLQNYDNIQLADQDNLNIHDVQYDSSASYLAIAGGTRISLYGCKDVDLLNDQLTDHKDHINGLSWGSQARVLASVAKDRQLKLWGNA